ncbi:MAG: MnhB domain-containing protein [Chloroflexota bacterium]
MRGPFESDILQFMVRNLLVPLMLIFGLHIVVHGEAYPGGGFPGGAMIGASIILARMSLDRDQSHRLMSSEWALRLAIIGAAISLATGVIPGLLGADVLDYSALPVPDAVIDALTHFTLRSIGIFAFEAGITITVAAVMVVIFDYLADYSNE